MRRTEKSGLFGDCSWLVMLAALSLVVGVACNDDPPSDGPGGMDGGDMTDGGPMPDGVDDPDGTVGDAGMDSGDVCMPTNGGTETCDGVDNDCDGTVDNDVEPTDCDQQDGVCDGATTTACSDGEYGACTAEDYGEDYADNDLENWRCDGLDNDCDGEVDEACCGAAGNDPEPTPVDLGDLDAPADQRHYDGFKLPAITEPADGAPGDAAFLAARVLEGAGGSGTVAIQHYTADGNTIGPQETIAVVQNVQGGGVRQVTGVAMVTTDRGYDVLFHTAVNSESVIGGQGFDESSLTVRPLNGDLSQDGSEVELYQGGAETMALARLHASEFDDRVVVAGTAYDQPETVNNAEVRVFSYDINNRANQFGEVFMPGPVTADTQSTTGDPADLVARPQTTHAENAGFAVSWITSFGGSNATVNAVKIDGSGSVGGSASQSFDTASGQTSRLATAWTSPQKLLLLHDDGSDLSSVTLNVNSGNASGRTEVLADATRPTWSVRDANDDGWADEATVSWLAPSSANAGELEVTADAFAFDSPASLGNDAQRIRLPNEGVSMPTAASVANGVGLAWPIQDDSGSRAEYAVVSQSGVGICQMSP